MKCARCDRPGHRENRCFFRGNPGVRGKRNGRILHDIQNDDWADCDSMSTSSVSLVENFEVEPERT